MLKEYLVKSSIHKLLLGYYSTAFENYKALWQLKRQAQWILIVANRIIFQFSNVLTLSIFEEIGHQIVSMYQILFKVNYNISSS